MLGPTPGFISQVMKPPQNSDCKTQSFISSNFVVGTLSETQLVLLPVVCPGFTHVTPVSGGCPCTGRAKSATIWRLAVNAAFVCSGSGRADEAAWVIHRRHPRFLRAETEGKLHTQSLFKLLAHSHLLLLHWPMQVPRSILEGSSGEKRLESEEEKAGAIMATAYSRER